MTPTFCWVFLLALVGRAASVPQPLVVDACALLCNPGAETESEQARDPVLYPRYPKVDCKLQSDSEDDQAWVISSQCMKLCNRELTTTLEVNCFALRSSLGAHLGCFCEALTPLSPNTMRLHESWRLNYLVKELANDILNVITDSPLDKIILCELHREFFKDTQLEKTPNGKLESCFMNSTSNQETEEEASKSSTRERRSVFSEKDFDDENTDELLKGRTANLINDPDILLPSIPDSRDREEDITEIPFETTKDPKIPIVTDHNHDTKYHNMDFEDNFMEFQQEDNPKEKSKEEPYIEKLCTECLKYCESKNLFGETDKDNILHVFCENCDLVEVRCKTTLLHKLSQ
ncbi:uncharacterized protein LOC105255577 [Camponotus floridanus]|uniref:uncharacterized protein LOC105255577 n=1 Tax=Camponotus floridanus TaxID=104421 RepID=UPI00059E9345|nr:uncharacterized protein LOC105255577 [Camponotus floridanus]